MQISRDRDHLEPAVNRQLAGISPLAFIVLVLPLACHCLGLVSRCSRIVWSCLFLSPSCLCLVFSSPCPLCVCHLRLVLVSACFLASRLVLSCCVSCLVFVSCCLVLPLPLSLFCLIGVVFVFMLRCAVCLSSWVALSTHFWSFGVVSGVDVGHFGSSWGALGIVLGCLLGVLGGLGEAWNGLESG